MNKPALPQKFNLAHYCLAKNARQSPEKTALIFMSDLEKEPETVSFAELEAGVLKFAAWLIESGFHKGDRAFLKLKTSAQFVSAFFGSIVAGLMPVPLSPLLSTTEVEKLASLAAPSLLVLDDEDEDLQSISELAKHICLRSQIDDILNNSNLGTYPDTKANDPAFMVFTSGTTAIPRAVVHAQRVILGRKPMFDGWTDIRQDDRVLHSGALNWTYALGVGLLDVCAASATACFYTGPTSPEIFPEIIKQSQSTIFAGVPSLYRRILKYGDMSLVQNSDLRHCLCAGEPLPAVLFNAWRERTGLTVYESLGMSEISTYISCSPTVKPRPGSPGKAQDGRKIAILSEETLERFGEAEYVLAGQSGLIAVHKSDPGLYLGLFKSGTIQPPQLTGDWFITGDLAHRDKDGYIWYEGRADEIMNPSGYRVSPLEVESALSQAQKIADLAVCEVEISEGLRVIMAFVVLAEGGNEDKVRRELEAFSMELAPYKRPREIKFLCSLPRTANGKLKRDEIARMP